MQNSFQLQFQRLWRGSDEKWRFFRQWLRHPRTTAAVSPSGARLVKAMMAELPDDARRVIELGAGTGVMTRALLARGIAPEDLLVFEFNPELHRHLTGEFPGVSVLCADACNLAAEVRGCGYAEHGLADAVISSLGLLSMSTAQQRAVMLAAFECLVPAGLFIQFTYGPMPPLRPEIVAELNLHVSRGATAFRNVPPATVYTYTRGRSRAIVPRQVR